MSLVSTTIPDLKYVPIIDYQIMTVYKFEFHNWHDMCTHILYTSAHRANYKN